MKKRRRIQRRRIVADSKRLFQWLRRAGGREFEEALSQARMFLERHGTLKYKPVQRLARIVQGVES